MNAEENDDELSVGEGVGASSEVRSVREEEASYQEAVHENLHPDDVDSCDDDVAVVVALPSASPSPSCVAAAPYESGSLPRVRWGR